MRYTSSKKILLFWLLVISIIVAIWLLWLGVDSYILTRDPLASVEQSRALTMTVLAVILMLILLAGLVLSTLLGNKRYSKYFSIFIGFLFIMLLIVRSLPK